LSIAFLIKTAIFWNCALDDPLLESSRFAASASRNRQGNRFDLLHASAGDRGRDARKSFEAAAAVTSESKASRRPGVCFRETPDRPEPSAVGAKRPMALLCDPWKDVRFRELLSWLEPPAMEAKRK
jgi:hypothetical protein